MDAALLSEAAGLLDRLVEATRPGGVEVRSGEDARVLRDLAGAARTVALLGELEAGGSGPAGASWRPAGPDLGRLLEGSLESALAVPLVGSRAWRFQDATKLGLGPARTHAALRAEAERRRWWALRCVDAAEAGAALDRLDRGGAMALLVADLRWLGPSLTGVLRALARSQRHGWRLVDLVTGLDSEAPAGSLATFLAVGLLDGAELDMGTRRRAAMASLRTRGVRVGRRPQIPAAVRRRIVAEAAAGRSPRQIATRLTADGVATARGGAGVAWRHTTVRSVLRSVSYDRELTANRRRLERRATTKAEAEPVETATRVAGSLAWRCRQHPAGGPFHGPGWSCPRHPVVGTFEFPGPCPLPPCGRALERVEALCPACGERLELLERPTATIPGR